MKVVLQRVSEASVGVVNELGTLDPAINCQFKSDMQHYAQLFWHCPLSDADYQKLVAS